MVCTVHIEPRAEARVRRLRDRWRLGGFVVIAALARHEFGESGDSWRALALTAAYPFAFFLTAVYPQATFLATAGLALLFARTGRWLAAAAAGYLAGLTHQTTVIL